MIVLISRDHIQLCMARIYGAELFKDQNYLKRNIFIFHTQGPCEVAKSTNLSILGIFFPVFAGTSHIPESSYGIFPLIETRLKRWSHVFCQLVQIISLKSSGECKQFYLALAGLPGEIPTLDKSLSAEFYSACLVASHFNLM